MASLKVEFCLKKKNPPEHKSSVTFVSKVRTIRKNAKKFKLVDFDFIIKIEEELWFPACLFCIQSELPQVIVKWRTRLF